MIHGGDVHNDHTIENLGRQSVVAAEAGADMIAPSSMMDGQVHAIRSALDGNGFGNIPIMAYSSKFASAFYGPFRAAAGCDLDGDRKAYQMNPMNGREALRESDVDEAEGADILMVKPAMPYLDVLTQIRQRSLLPLAAYQVSGEYAMIKFAAEGRRDRRAPGGAGEPGRDQARRGRPDPDLFRHGYRSAGVLTRVKPPRRPGVVLRRRA